MSHPQLISLRFQMEQVKAWQAWDLSDSVFPGLERPSPLGTLAPTATGTWLAQPLIDKATKRGFFMLPIFVYARLNHLHHVFGDVYICSRDCRPTCLRFGPGQCLLIDGGNLYPNPVWRLHLFGVVDIVAITTSWSRLFGLVGHQS